MNSDNDDDNVVRGDDSDAEDITLVNIMELPRYNSSLNVLLAALSTNVPKLY